MVPAQNNNYQPSLLDISINNETAECSKSGVHPFRNLNMN